MKRQYRIYFCLAALTLAGCNEEKKLAETLAGTYTTRDAACHDQIAFHLDGTNLVFQINKPGSQPVAFPLEGFNKILLQADCNPDAMVAVCIGQKIVADETSLKLEELMINYTNMMGVRSETITTLGTPYSFQWNSARNELYANIRSNHQCIYQKHQE